VALAGPAQAELLMLHVVSGDGSGADAEQSDAARYLRAARESRLDDWIGQNVPAGLKVRKLLRFGPAALEILEAAHEHGADIIVIATHGETGWRRLVFGSVTESVVRQARCPVLAVPSPQQ
jgi:nucleotide-binding universal stress UspA family protein